MAKKEKPNKESVVCRGPRLDIFRDNIQHLTNDDLAMPIVQQEFADIANNTQFPERIRKLARDLVINKSLLDKKGT